MLLKIRAAWDETLGRRRGHPKRRVAFSATAPPEMTPTTDTYVLLRAFVDELARCGMRMACTSPGSRCAPLVLTLAREERLECHSHIDERCAGFFALGTAKASGLPVAVTCTSGTAVAELLPAALEAHEARVPLLLLSADRPPELRENGAGQAIDQLKLFGDAAKWFFEVGTHDASTERLRWIRTLACRAYWTALEGRPGVVHLNFPLREPLVTDEPLPADDTGRTAGMPYVRRPPVSVTGDATPAGTRRAKPGAGSSSPGATSARPRSGSPPPRSVRRSAGPCWPIPCPARAAEAPPSRTTTRCCATTPSPRRSVPTSCCASETCPSPSPCGHGSRASGVRQVTLDPEGAWQDPGSVLSDSFAVEPAATLAGLSTPRQRRHSRFTRPLRGTPAPPTAARRPGLARELAQRRRAGGRGDPRCPAR